MSDAPFALWQLTVFAIIIFGQGIIVHTNFLHINTNESYVMLTLDAVSVNLPDTHIDI